MENMHTDVTGVKGETKKWKVGGGDVISASVLQ